MEEAFSETIKILKTTKDPTSTIILGNISCDLDSAVCPVVYSFFLHWQHRGLRDRVCTREHRAPNQSCRQIYVPILNVDREDYELKTEVSYWFKENRVFKKFLIFRDDVDLNEMSKSATTKVILVDHHILSEADNFLLSNVSEVIDHRPKDSEHWCYGEQVRADIQQVGSCSSLICDRIRQARDGEQFFKEHPECANLIYGTIILDTVNFSKDIKKGTPTDLEQITFLEEILHIEDVEGHRQATLERLKDARSDVSSLSSDQLLRKDVKTCGDILAPSFPVLVEEILNRSDVEEALTATSSRYRCKSAVMMGVRLSAPPRRDLAVWCPHEEMRHQLAKLLEDWTDPPLGLTMQAARAPDCEYYTQANLTASRKQIMPALAHFASQYRS